MKSLKQFKHNYTFVAIVNNSNIELNYQFIALFEY